LITTNFKQLQTYLASSQKVEDLEGDGGSLDGWASSDLIEEQLGLIIKVASNKSSDSNFVDISQAQIAID